MKRLIAMLLCLLMLAVSLPVAAEGEAAVVTTVASATTLQRGDTLTLTVKVENSPKVSTLALAMGNAWDKNVFEFVSAKWLLSGAILKNVDTNKYNAVILYGKPRSFDGDVLEIQLKVKNTSGFGHTCITAGAVFESADAGYPVALVSAQVQIVCPHSWQAADCAYPEHCTICGTTQGTALGHDYQGNTCSRCGDTKQEAASTTTTTIPTSVITTTTSADSTTNGTTQSTTTAVGSTPLSSTTVSAPTGGSMTTIIIGTTTTTRTDANGSVITDPPTTTTRTDASGSVITDPPTTTTRTDADGSVITDPPTTTTRTDANGSVITDAPTTQTTPDGSVITTTTESTPSQDAITVPNEDDDSRTWVFVLLCVVVAVGIGAAVTAVLLRKKK